ncbi:transposable element Tc1 transposase [Trichonephila clavipes]|nr:transposable element Tc1 transposase [Trichonephila clavipes]
MVSGVISFEAEPLWLSLEANLQHIDTSTALENCFDAVPFTVPWSYFLADNARPLTARVAMNSLIAYQTLPCPAKSPASSTIEPVFDIMGRQLYLQRNVDDLAQQLEQIWQEIPQETIRVLYRSMTNHVAACVQVRGKSTPYRVRYFVNM